MKEFGKSIGSALFSSPKKQGNPEMSGTSTEAQDSASNVFSPSKKQRSLKPLRTPTSTAKQSSFKGLSSAAKVSISSNQDTLMVVKESEDNSICLYLSNSRSGTSLSGKQGDHVTAYVSFLQMLISSSEGLDIKEVPNIIKDMAIAVMPDKRGVFEGIISSFDGNIGNHIISKERRGGIIELLGDIITQNTSQGKSFPINELELQLLEKALVSQTRGHFINLIEKIGTSFLKQINLEEGVAFNRINPEERDNNEEGENVKKAFHTLKLINDIENLGNTENIDNSCLYIYNNYIRTGSKYIRGFNILSGVFRMGNKNATEEKEIDYTKAFIKKYFSSKCNNENEIYSMSVRENALLGLGGRLSGRNKATSPSTEIYNLISHSLGELYDFKITTTEDGEERDPDVLAKVTARHLVCMFHAFRFLQRLEEDEKTKIRENFLCNTILGREGWESMGYDLKSLSDAIEEHANLGEYRMRSNEERLSCKLDIVHGYSHGQSNVNAATFASDSAYEITGPDSTPTIIKNNKNTRNKKGIENGV